MALMNVQRCLSQKTPHPPKPSPNFAPPSQPTFPKRRTTSPTSIGESALFSIFVPSFANSATKNRLLSHTATLDTTLLTISYTLRLLHSLLTRLPLISSSSRGSNNNHTARYQRLLFTLVSSRPAFSLKSLTGLLDETRIVLRLWGLLGIYTWGASTYSSPPKDPILRLIAWSEIGSCAVYQALENGAFLADKGVLWGWSKQKVSRAWVWSSRAWMLYVGLELSRLGYEYRQQQQQQHDGLGHAEARRGKGAAETVQEGKEAEAGDGSSVVVVAEQEGELKVALNPEGELELRRQKAEEQQQQQQQEWWGRWKKDLNVNAAYAPMTVHYSREQGLLSESAIGVLGVVVAWWSFGDAWRASA
ncbi:MAG: hypothetical protein Q9163_000244 [Psora crenata]